MANGIIVNFSFDTNDQNIRKEIITYLFNKGIIDIEVKFIVNDDNEHFHKIIKPAETTLIFYSTKQLREIADIINKEQPAIYNFAISEVQVVGYEVKAIINKLDLQDSADKEMSDAIEAGKKKNEGNLTGRIENSEKYYKSTNSFPTYRINQRERI